MIDLSEEMRAALTHPSTVEALRGVIRPIVDEAVAEAMKSDSLLSGKEAAAFLGLSYGAFKQRMATEPALRAIALGTGARRYKKTDLERYQAERRPVPRRRPHQAA